MKIDIDVSLTYELGVERMALLTIEAARIEGQVVAEEQLAIDDAVLRHIEGENGLGQRTWVQVRNNLMRLHYRATVRLSRAPVQIEDLMAAPLAELPAEQITFLRPSRFCQSDQFETFTARKFGHLSGGQKIMAFADWVVTELEYAPGHSNAQTTLLDTFTTRKGVCRDYAHMLCGLARAAHIPARYVSAYGAAVNPPDFHAVVQVWLGNQWHLIDPTGMCAADELVLIGVGRDAADVPFMETPDEARLVNQQIWVTNG